MAKDPAFLFYSKDFYEGTRMMLPSERACYIDLLIYQHQHGIIPLDLNRVLMYCSGIDQATLEATLEAKFKRTEKGYINERIKDEIEKRADYTSKQSTNGRVGQMMKSAKSLFKVNDYKSFKEYVYEHLGKEKALDLLDKKETTLEGLLQASLKHLANGDVNVNKDVNSFVINVNNERLKNSVLEFMEHRSSIKKPFKSQMQLDKWVQSLKRLSEQDVKKAILIIDCAIANGWQGIFDVETSVKKNKVDGKMSIEEYREQFFKQTETNQNLIG